ncbi:MAG: mRNA surveillance protein pelota [Nitrososphaerales archaeon]
MIVSAFSKNQGFLELIPEDLEDLWVLRRVLKPNDLVSGKTTRVIKRKGIFSRPEKERIKVSVKLRVDKVMLDGTLARLRISGKILESSNEKLISEGYHSLNVSPRYKLSIIKERWEKNHLDLIFLRKNVSKSFLIVALDHREVALALLAGTHLKLLKNFTSDFEGKLYPKRGFNKQSYFNTIAKALMEDDFEIVIVGPGNLKRELSNYLKEKINNPIHVIEGVDIAGEEGILQTLKNINFRNIIRGSKLERAYFILEEALKRLAKKDEKIVFSLDSCLKASELGAINSLLISDKVFQKADEEVLVKMIDMVERNRGEVYFLDNTTDLGIHLDSLGGALALLRFPIN